MANTDNVTLTFSKPMFDRLIEVTYYNLQYYVYECNSSWEYHEEFITSIEILLQANDHRMNEHVIDFLKDYADTLAYAKNNPFVEEDMQPLMDEVSNYLKDLLCES